MKKINVLVTEYTIEYKTELQDKFLEDSNGYCDITSKRIVILSEKRETDEIDVFKFLQYKTIRHELVHAFLFESGLFNNTYNTDGGWAKNEEMVDWIATQFPKLLEAFKEAECI